MEGGKVRIRAASNAIESVVLSRLCTWLGERIHDH